MMRTVRIWKNYGFYLGFRSGTFWFRTNKYVYMAKAPWNEPLFSERYVHKPRSYFGWRFFKRDVPDVELLKRRAQQAQEELISRPSNPNAAGSIFHKWLDEERK